MRYILHTHTHTHLYTIVHLHYIVSYAGLYGTAETEGRRNLVAKCNSYFILSALHQKGVVCYLARRRGLCFPLPLYLSRALFPLFDLLKDLTTLSSHLRALKTRKMKCAFVVHMAYLPSCRETDTFFKMQHQNYRMKRIYT